MTSQGWTQVKLAEVSGYDERTVRNILNAKEVKPQTRHDICTAVGISIGAVNQEDDPIASIQLGGYSKASVDIYIGYYSVYRRSFTTKDEIVKSYCKVIWSTEENCLLFEELDYGSRHNAPEILHSGTVYFALDTALVHFLTTDRGALRIITLTRINMQDRLMRGVIMSQVDKVSFYQPTASPIFLKLLGEHLDEENMLQTGYIAKDTMEYSTASDELQEIEKNILKFVC